MSFMLRSFTYFRSRFSHISVHICISGPCFLPSTITHCATSLNDVTLPPRVCLQRGQPSVQPSLVQLWVALHRSATRAMHDEVRVCSTFLLPLGVPIRLNRKPCHQLL
ncbi:hypothetical protein V6N12_000369 [Hibiscus sabdariffa]|uniref:Secreted protein n=1 Tax=Hibiscus sabdariffa TaxID=183260 RepID=A0ABR2BIG5_9ROSI